MRLVYEVNDGSRHHRLRLYAPWMNGSRIDEMREENKEACWMYVTSRQDHMSSNGAGNFQLEGSAEKLQGGMNRGAISVG